MKCLLERVLRRLLVTRPRAVVEKSFQRITSSTQLQTLRDGLRLFLLHFLQRKRRRRRVQDDDDDDDVVVDDVANDDELRQRLKLAEKLLASAAS